MASPARSQASRIPHANNTTRRRRRILSVCMALASLAATSTASALEITMFPARDFVTIGALHGGDVVDVDLLRNGVVVGQAHNIAAFQENPSDPLDPWVVLVNHPGGPNKCWEISTPDVIAGDVFRVTVTSGPDQGTIDTAPVADVEVTQAPTQVNGDIIVKGFAQSAPGVPVPLVDLEQRLIHAPGGDLFDNAGFPQPSRRLSAPDGPNRTLVFDSAGSIFWTATYKSLTNADRVEAQAAEARILHFGDPDPNDPAIARDLTIFEFGVPAGPFDATCPPIDKGPSLQLTTSSDSGASASDNVTRNTSPTLAGQRGTLVAGPVANLYDTTSGVPVLIGSSPILLDGSFVVTPTSPLSDGLHILRAGHAGTGPTDTMGASIAVMIDTQAPAAPPITSVTPLSPANDNAPRIAGTAETNATVRLYANGGCTGLPFATTTAAAFPAGVSASVADDSITTFAATAEDVAGNLSACGPGSIFTEVTPKPVAALITSTATVRRTSWVVPLAVRCSGPADATCRGRLSLTIKGTNKRTGKRTDIVLGTTTYSVKAGGKRTVKITLNSRGRTLLEHRTSLTVRVTLRAAAGGGIATSTRTSITLRAPQVEPAKT